MRVFGFGVSHPLPWLSARLPHTGGSASMRRHVSSTGIDRPAPWLQLFRQASAPDRTLAAPPRHLEHVPECPALRPHRRNCLEMEGAWRLKRIIDGGHAV